MSAPKRDLAAIVAAYEEGSSVPALAAEFGVPASSLYAQLHRAGLAMRKSSGRPLLPADVREQVLELSRQGKSYTEVAAATGVSDSYIYTVRREAGVVRARKGGAA